MRPKTAKTSRVVHLASGLAALYGAVLSPLPLADELLLLPLYGALTAALAWRERVPLARIPWRPIGATALRGLVARAGVTLVAGTVPGVAAVINAASAVALTEIVGRHATTTLRDPANARALAFAELTTALRPHRAGRP